MDLPCKPCLFFLPYRLQVRRELTQLTFGTVTLGDILDDGHEYRRLRRDKLETHFHWIRCAVLAAMSRLKKQCLLFAAEEWRNQFSKRLPGK